MHTDKDANNLPISLARPELLACTEGTRTHMHVHEHTPEKTDGRYTRTASFSKFKMSSVIFVTHTVITEAILAEAPARKLNVEVRLLMYVCQKDY